MNRSVTINKMSEQMGLTSRTLRHWESEGLFRSERDPSSGWRVYDENAILSIRIIALLRKFDIPLKEIKTVIANINALKLYTVINNRILALEAQKEEIIRYQNRLERILKYLRLQDSNSCMDKILAEMEAVYMDNRIENKMYKIVNLPPMRVAYHISVSTSPEDEAMTPVMEWILSSNLEGTARFFGGNVKPFPGRIGAPYGYGMCTTIPESIHVPKHLKEMVLPGGLYAMMESSDDVGESWKILMKGLTEDDKYHSDRSRLCLEEHIRNESSASSGGMLYHLNLLEPVKLK
ncbi:hypothetical protein GCM10010912_69690 [Paenibacillus albidus]|uniref:HTH merR-type domain-containing protein n=1 Tax=Paenibacillus albidus TaxID=2041023 RepID=A0A917FZK2_9BACL|nr:MerR family transcriptional regulator [Paenibacillus albidus]GGG15312.1 hypothetical protein GCM10010912_69690 [Paenibacillus albidus]